MVALSAVFFGSYGIWARLIGTDIGNFFQVYSRCAIILCILLPIGYFTHSLKPIAFKDWKWIAIYTLFGGLLTQIPYFYAFNILGIGSATLLFYASYTIVSFVLGVLFFGEQMTWDKLCGLICAIAGLSILYHVSFLHHQVFAACLAVIAGLAGGVEVVFTKKVSHTYSPLELSIFIWVVTFFGHLIGSFIFHEYQFLSFTSPLWLPILGYAIASISAFFLVVSGYKYVEPSIGGLTGLLEILFGIGFGMLFFKEQLTPQIVIGGTCILLAAALPNIVNLKRK